MLYFFIDNFSIDNIKNKPLGIVSVVILSIILLISCFIQSADSNNDEQNVGLSQESRLISPQVHFVEINWLHFTILVLCIILLCIDIMSVRVRQYILDLVFYFTVIFFAILYILNLSTLVPLIDKYISRTVILVILLLVCLIGLLSLIFLSDNM
jgi:hypothetical protein